MTKGLKNGDKKQRDGRVGENNILTFLSYCTRHAICLFIFKRVWLFIKLKKLHFEQFFLFVFVKFRNS